MSTQEWRQNMPILAHFWDFLWEFFVEHTGVRKRQRDGTLERVVKYDKEAFFRQGSGVDSIESEWWRGRLIHFFFGDTFFLLGKGRNTASFGPTEVFSAVRPHCSITRKKKGKKRKKTVFSAQKTPTNSTKKTKIKSDTFKGSHKHNFPDLWDSGSINHTTNTLMDLLYVY